MQDFFNNKVVAITGGTDGIGKALVEILLKYGAKVATCGRNQDKLYQLQTQHAGQPLHAVIADIGNAHDCEMFINTTLENYEKIDILINNAGISMRALVNDTEIDTIKKVMDINFYGVVNCTKVALPSIIQNKGTVVGVSSIAGYRGLPGRSGYSASKFALQGFLESLRTELLKSDVNVMWVCPGFTASNIRKVALNNEGESHGESPMNEKNMMSSEECAQHILKAIYNKKRTLVLTKLGKLTVFLNKFFPKFADKMVYNNFFNNNQLIK